MDEPSITLHIKFGSDSLQAALPATASVKDLKAHLQSLTNVLPRGQKLIFKGKILEDSVTLKAANLSDGSKIMLMASHGVHQGGGLIKKDSPQTVSKKGLEAKPTRKLNLEKATDITRLQRWKATGVISLFESGLEVVPEDVFAVGPSTRVLDIGDNCLQEVPAEIGNLTNLQKLRLTANNLSDDRIKWQGLVSLKCLTVLALNSNRLCQLPAEIGMLISLKQLNLAQNNLASIPEEVGQLQQLQILNLNNNCLKALPLTIGHCCSLLEADFSSNLLGEIPSTLGNLQNIKVLQLGNNGLRSFPTNVLKGCSQLSTLDLHGNEVTIEDLREVEGWVEFDERRRSKHSKQIEFGVMGSSGFDEGADSQHWNQW
ncbi:plant intracellular Ras-group-related LRR protein 8 isoform X1 [Cryptomeria japonica]|uniref:plant intracellular Ras-group-related LRR protein 8 isoform X1 n=1 Tax=Cryptomeria japonica TaxID=3369 RepID=UPI0025AC9B9E|nr:plant intracellular Ras-group-related LRR protein 8 isoform X1 [Cryptomeria japonica]